MGKLQSKLANLFRGYSVDYSGATTLPEDVRQVYQRYRRGESLLDGPNIAEFEKNISDYYGGLGAITFGAGRMALYAILKSLRLKAGAEVILPGYTCVVTSNAIRFAGLQPRYVDISENDFNMAPEEVRKSLNKNTGAILAQHTFGIPCQLDILSDISQQTGIPLIEDGAHAIGARWNNELVGRFGRASFFSMQATKMISTERGGYAVTKDNELAEKIREIQIQSVFPPQEQERLYLHRWIHRGRYNGNVRLNAWVRLSDRLAQKFHIKPVYDFLNVGQKEYEDSLAGRQFQPYPIRLGNLMAYAGILQLSRVDEDVINRQQLVEYLESELPKLGAKIPVYDHKRARPSWNRYPVIVENRSRWQELMNQCGLSAGDWLSAPIHPQGSDFVTAGYQAGMCPTAEKAARQIINISVDRRVSLARLEKWMQRCRRKLK